MPGEKVLYLSKENVELLNISIKDVIDVLERMFKEKGKGNVEMPPKPGIHTRKDAFIHAMPAYIPSMDSAGLKWVGGYPENYKKNLPYITGLLILNDPETGVPLAIMDCTWITAIRTGAATAVAAKYLARQNAEVIGILGCGVQGESNLVALNEVCSIKEVKVYDTLNVKSEAYSTTLGEKLGIDIEVKRNVRDTVEGSDIVVTAGPFLANPDPVIEYLWLKEGVFCCPLDLDSYFKPEIFSKSDLLCTDDLGQFHHFREEGFFSGAPERILDLGDIVCGKSPKRENEKQIITSINIGIALEDMAVAPLVYQRAKVNNIGIWLDL